MTDGILVINTEKLVVLRNAAAARILPGCAQKEIPFPLAELQNADVQEILELIIDSTGGPMILSREIALGKETYMVNASPGDRAGRADVWAPWPCSATSRR